MLSGPKERHTMALCGAQQHTRACWPDSQHHSVPWLFSPTPALNFSSSWAVLPHLLIPMQPYHLSIILLAPVSVLFSVCDIFRSSSLAPPTPHGPVHSAGHVSKKAKQHFKIPVVEMGVKVYFCSSYQLLNDFVTLEETNCPLFQSDKVRVFSMYRYK